MRYVVWAWACLAILGPASAGGAEDPPRIRISSDGRGFVAADSGRPFTPWGFNYDHDEQGRLLEDYWEEDWPRVAAAFEEMKRLGANVVRIHLQFGKFMESAARPRGEALVRLQRLLDLAAANGLYLDLTGLGCYHKADTPAWYDALSESDRWAAQAAFWEAVARACRGRSVVFCYDLMNEPVAPGGDQPRQDWLGPAFAGKHFVQFISLDRNGRQRSDLARAWIQQLSRAIRQHDQETLITVGLVPWSLERPGLTSGFDPLQIAADLDFLAVHLYPEQGKVKEALETLEAFAAAGKPVVIEETFPLKAGLAEFELFLDRSRGAAQGWIGFFWGKTPGPDQPAESIGEAMLGGWLELFQKKRNAFVAGGS